MLSLLSIVTAGTRKICNWAQNRRIKPDAPAPNPYCKRIWAEAMDEANKSDIEQDEQGPGGKYNNGIFWKTRLYKNCLAADLKK